MFYMNTYLCISQRNKSTKVLNNYAALDITIPIGAKCGAAILINLDSLITTWFIELQNSYNYKTRLRGMFAMLAQ